VGRRAQTVFALLTAHNHFWRNTAVPMAGSSW
jgi:hypothetical protein